MQKRKLKHNPGSKLARIIILFVVLVSTKLLAWSLPDSLLGHWYESFEANKVFIKQPDGTIHPDSLVRVDIFVQANGNVFGSVGEARLVRCRIKKNRTWLGRMLNFKTDFIIRGGYLEGGVVSRDIVQKREFTIPFNIKNRKMRGSIMILQRWKYPYPLLPHLRLQRELTSEL